MRTYCPSIPCVLVANKIDSRQFFICDNAANNS